MPFATTGLMFRIANCTLYYLYYNRFWAKNHVRLLAHPSVGAQLQKKGPAGSRRANAYNGVLLHIEVIAALVVTYRTRGIYIQIFQ